MIFFCGFGGTNSSPSPIANPAPTVITADDRVRGICAIVRAITDAITGEAVGMGEVPAATNGIHRPAKCYLYNFSSNLSKCPKKSRV